MKTLGQRLRHLRVTQDLTQEELAVKLKVNRSTLANWEVDRATPDAEMLGRLADAFGTSTDVLLGRTEQAPDSHPRPDIRRLARAGEKLTPEQSERLLAMAKVIFPELEDDEDSDEPKGRGKP